MAVAFNGPATIGLGAVGVGAAAATGLAARRNAQRMQSGPAVVDEAAETAARAAAREVTGDVTVAAAQKGAAYNIAPEAAKEMVAAQAAASPGVLATVGSTAQLAVEHPFEAFMLGTAATKATGWAGKHVAKVSPKVGGALGAPARALDFTVADVAGKFGIRDRVAKTANSSASWLAHKIDNSPVVQKALGWNASRAEKNATAAFARAQTHARIDVGALPEGLRGPVGELAFHINGAATHAHVNSTEIAGLLERVASAEKTAGKIPSAAKKEFKALLGSATKLVDRAQSHTTFSNVGNAIKKLPSAIGGTKSIRAAENALYLGMSGMQIAGTAENFSQRLSALHQLAEDITGKKMSTMGLLFGSVPHIVAEERAHLLANSGIDAAESVASTALTVKSFTRHVGFLKFMIPSFAAMGAKTIVSDSDVIKTYAAAKEAFAAGKLTAENYAAFASMACKDCQNHRGGENNPVIQELAKQFAAEKLSPAATLQMSEKGEIAARIKKITASAAAAPQAVEFTSPAATSNVSFTSRLNGETAVAPAPPVVGAHTNHVVTERAAQPLAPTVAG